MDPIAFPSPQGAWGQWLDSWRYDQPGCVSVPRRGVRTVWILRWWAVWRFDSVPVRGVKTVLISRINILSSISFSPRKGRKDSVKKHLNSILAEMRFCPRKGLRTVCDMVYTADWILCIGSMTVNKCLIYTSWSCPKETFFNTKIRNSCLARTVHKGNKVDWSSMLIPILDQAGLFSWISCAYDWSIYNGLSKSNETDIRKRESRPIDAGSRFLSPEGA